MRARLFSLEWGLRPIVLDSYPVFLGIGEDDGLQISEQPSSARRCQISLEDGTLVAVDLDSAEGTWVNGEPIKRAPLLPGDKLHIGPMAMIVSYERLTRRAPPEVLYRSTPTLPLVGKLPR